MWQESHKTAPMTLMTLWVLDTNWLTRPPNGAIVMILRNGSQAL